MVLVLELTCLNSAKICLLSYSILQKIQNDELKSRKKELSCSPPKASALQTREVLQNPSQNQAKNQVQHDGQNDSALLELPVTKKTFSSEKSETILEGSNPKSTSNDKTLPVVASQVPSDPNDLRFFVQNLPANMNKIKLAEYFDRYGKIEDIYIHQLRGKINEIQRKVAFLTFSCFYAPSLLTLKHVIDRQHILVRKMKVAEFFDKGKLVTKSRSLMLTGVLESTSNWKILEYFSKFGKIVRFTRPADQNQKVYKRYAFVIFKDSTAVDEAVLKMHHIVDNHVIDVRRVKDQNV